MEGFSAFSPRPTVFLGGFGEPLFHSNILEMVWGAKKQGTSAQLITNGTLLSKEISKGLIEAELDFLWVSIDGASAESYADVRLDAAGRFVSSVGAEHNHAHVGPYRNDLRSEV